MKTCQLRKGLVFSGWHVKKTLNWFNICHKSLITKLTFVFLCQDIGTAIVSDTTDDLWFLNESVSEELGVGIKVEAASSEQASEVGKASDKKVCLNIFTLIVTVFIELSVQVLSISLCVQFLDLD